MVNDIGATYFDAGVAKGNGQTTNQEAITQRRGAMGQARLRPSRRAHCDQVILNGSNVDRCVFQVMKLKGSGAFRPQLGVWGRIASILPSLLSAERAQQGGI